jgi:hypothetical protein
LAEVKCLFQVSRRKLGKIQLASERIANYPSHDCDPNSDTVVPMVSRGMLRQGSLKEPFAEPRMPFPSSGVKKTASPSPGLRFTQIVLVSFF